MDPQIKEDNANLLHLLESGQEKVAAEINTDYLRMRVRESCITERLLPSEKIGNDELDKDLNSEHPLKILSKETGSPGAISVPYGAFPVEHYFRGDKYAVKFNRYMTAKVIKDVGELRTTDYDIRRVLADNQALDLDEEIDAKFFAVVDGIIGAANTNNPLTGAIQHVTTADAISRDGIFDMMKVLPQTPTRAETATVVCNNISIKDVAKFGRDEMGGDLAQEIMLNGFAERTFAGARWIITIKHEQVPNNAFYLFTEPKFIGKHLVLEDTTMHIKKEAFMLESFSYRESGLTIGNVASVARYEFNVP